jgi:hypothetical protein
MEMVYDRWPKWFDVPPELRYQEKRQKLLTQYKRFIEKWPQSHRMPIALYYQAILNEYSPDIPFFMQTEILRFYTDYPHHENLPIWHQIFSGFPQSPESIEARYRYAVHLAGRSEFDTAGKYAEVADVMIQEFLEKTTVRGDKEVIWSAFSPTPNTVMTETKIKRLQLWIREFLRTIGTENFSKDVESQRRLARFVILNPYRRDYSDQLQQILNEMPENDPLRDNIHLARTLLLKDDPFKAEQLLDIHEKYAQTDSAVRALYELGLLKVRLWKAVEDDDQLKPKLLSDARLSLRHFIETYPDSIYLAPVETVLQGLPAAEQ